MKSRDLARLDRRQASGSRSQTWWREATASPVLRGETSLSVTPRTGMVSSQE